MWWLLLCLAKYVSADLTNVVVVQSFNLKTTGNINITCSNIKEILVDDTPVTNYNCIGTITDAKDNGMWIITETQPIFLRNEKLKWVIEHASGNLTSSFTVDNAMDKPLTTSSNITVNASAKEKYDLSIKLDQNERLLQETEIDSRNVKKPKLSDNTPTTTTATSTTMDTKATTTTTIKPTATSTPATTMDTNATTTATSKPTATSTTAPTSILITVTIGYMQFQMGQAPVYLNNNSQAVTIAVIEGLILTTILAVVLFKFYKKSKLIAAGQYPSTDIFQPNSTDNTVYYDDGAPRYGNGRESNARSQIPSYRAQVNQPSVRLHSLQPPPEQQVSTPTLMPITTSTTVTQAWPDQREKQQPVKNIIDSDF